MNRRDGNRLDSFAHHATLRHVVATCGRSATIFVLFSSSSSVNCLSHNVVWLESWHFRIAANWNGGVRHALLRVTHVTETYSWSNCDWDLPIRTHFAVVTKFTSLAEGHGAHGASEGLSASVSVFVLFAVLGQTELFFAVLAFVLLFRVVTLVVTSERVLWIEFSSTLVNVALKDFSLFFSDLLKLFHFSSGLRLGAHLLFKWFQGSRSCLGRTSLLHRETLASLSWWHVREQRTVGLSEGCLSHALLCLESMCSCCFCCHTRLGLVVLNIFTPYRWCLRVNSWVLPILLLAPTKLRIVLLLLLLVLLAILHRWTEHLDSSLRFNSLESPGVHTIETSEITHG